jgi:hypothetical protein
MKSTPLKQKLVREELKKAITHFKDDSSSDSQSTLSRATRSYNSPDMISVTKARKQSMIAPGPKPVLKDPFAMTRELLGEG